MAFGDSFSKPDIGGVNAAKHHKSVSDAVLLAEKVRLFLGYGIYSPIHRYQVRVWASVVWVWVPGYRPRFIPLSAIA